MRTAPCETTCDTIADPTLSDRLLVAGGGGGGGGFDTMGGGSADSSTAVGADPGDGADGAGGTGINAGGGGGGTQTSGGQAGMAGTGSAYSGVDGKPGLLGVGANSTIGDDSFGDASNTGGAGGGGYFGGGSGGAGGGTSAVVGADGGGGAGSSFANSTSVTNATFAVATAGTSPTVTITPANLVLSNGAGQNGLDFGSNQIVGTTSDSQTVTVTNNGNVPLTGFSATASGDFVIATDQPSNACGTETTLGIGDSCVVAVAFAPTTTGDRTGTLKISGSDAANDSASTTVDLSGTAVAGDPELSAGASSLTFARQLVGTTSDWQQVTVTNTGNVPLSDLAATTTGDFQASNACNGSLAVNASCTVSVRYEPTTSGAESGTLTVANGAKTGDDPTSVTVDLSGTGEARDPELGTDAGADGVMFADTKLGETNKQTVTVSNAGNVPLAITSVTISDTDASGEFAIANNTCDGTMLPVGTGTTCTVEVTFAPGARGTVHAALEIDASDTGAAPNATNADTSTNVDLTGDGIDPQVSVDKASGVDFGDRQPLSTTSAPQTITVTNSGNSDLTVSNVTLVGDDPNDFEISNNTCGSGSIPAGTTCTLQVAFTPQATGARDATLEIDSDDPASPTSVPLTGTAIPGTPIATILAPSGGHTYTVGQEVSTTFRCTEGEAGSGITTCTDSNGATAGTGALDTSQAGTFTYTVTATSSDGEIGKSSITYTVVSPAATTTPITTASGGSDSGTKKSATAAVLGVKLTTKPVTASKGATLSLTLPQKAKIKVVISQTIKGRLAHGVCNARARSGRRCSKTVTRRTLRFSESKGHHALDLKLKGLPAGHYTAAITVTGANGRTATVKRGLTIA